MQERRQEGPRKEIAEDLARYASNQANLSGEVVIFRVRKSTIDESRIYVGLETEYEYLIEGTVENVEFSENDDDDD